MLYYLLSVQSHLSSVVVNNPIHSFFFALSSEKNPQVDNGKVYNTKN